VEIFGRWSPTPSPSPNGKAPFGEGRKKAKWNV